MSDDLKKAYQGIMSTNDGALVLKDLLQKFALYGAVYKLDAGATNELSDLAFRDGQRNSGSYIIQNMINANPEKTAQIQAEIFKDVVKSENSFLKNSGEE